MGILEMVTDCLLSIAEHARAATRSSEAAERYWEAGVRNTAILEQVNTVELARRQAHFAEEEAARSKVREVTTEIRGLTGDMSGFRSTLEKAMRGSEGSPK